jgi:hypothetical protein
MVNKNQVVNYTVTIKGQLDAAGGVSPEDIEAALGAYFGSESGLTIEAN